MSSTVSGVFPKPITIDSAGVGSYTIVSTENLDARRVLAFSSVVNAQGEAFFDDTRPDGLSVHPGIAFVLQFNSQARPGHAVGRAEDWIGAVHAETDLRIMKPFSLGQEITTQGRLVTRKQLRSGVYNVERYRMTDADGDLVAEMDFNLIFRAAVLKGGDVEIAQAPIRPEPSTKRVSVSNIEVHVSRSSLHQYTACSGIYAPIHTEKRVAIAAGFADIILHGSAVKSIALSSIIAAYFGGDAKRIKRLYGQLRAVVLADTTIRIEILATTTTASELQVFFRVLNSQGETAVANGFVIGDCS